MTARARAAAAVFALHVAVSAGHAAFSGVRIAANRWLEWNSFFQVLPIELLDARLGPALWHLHMQPPLWNLLGALLHRLFGDGFQTAMHVLQVGLGGLLCALLYGLLLDATGRPRLSFVLAVLHALDPALVLFEAYALYPLAVAFLTTALVAAAARFERRRTAGALLGAVALVNVLVLTRSLYHPALALLVAAAAVALAPARRSRIALAAALLCLPTVLWVAKNQALFGVPGTSSWFGQNVWRSVASNYSKAELAALAEAGVVAPVTAALPAFMPPVAFRSWGFDRTGGPPELDGEHYNDLDEIDISRVYGRSAARLFLHDPARGLRGAARGVLIYTAPASRFSHLEGNRERIAAHDRLYSGILLGDDWLRLPGDLGASGPVFAALALLAAVLGARRVRREARALGTGLLGWLRQRPALALAALLAGYNLAVGCLFDFGENQRFKFEVGALWWLLLAWALAARPREASVARLAAAESSAQPSGFSSARAQAGSSSPGRATPRNQ